MDTPAFTTFHSPVGPLRIVVTGFAITHVLFPNEDLPPDAAPTQSRLLSETALQLDEYFSGSRLRFNLPVSTSGSGFIHRARLVLESIPYGTRWTYSQLADAAGNRRAVRAAGTACATNPLPILIPCHRVVRADGTVGNYRGGTEIKQWLLNFESCVAEKLKTANHTSCNHPALRSQGGD